MEREQNADKYKKIKKQAVTLL